MKNYSTFRPCISLLNRAMLAVLLIGALTSLGQSQTTTSSSPGSGNKTSDSELIFRTNPFTTAAVNAEELTKIEPNQLLPANPFDDACQGNPTCVEKRIKSLRLNIPARFARAFQYQYELNEQPGTLLVDIERDGETRTAQARNFQHYLQKHTFSLKLSELFPDRLAMFKRGASYRNGDGVTARLLCGNKPLITCLTKNGRWWQRFFMGITLEFSLSERPLVKDRLLVIDEKFGKTYQPHGAFVFDPVKLFPNATNWKATLDAVQGIDKPLALIAAPDALQGKEPWKKWWAFVVPKVEFKILSQFDFLKLDNVFIVPRFPERALNTWKFTWDLTRLIPDTQSRLDADAISQTLDSLKNSLGLDEPKKQCILHYPNGDRKVDVKPGFNVESCQQLAKDLGAATYELSCVGVANGPATIPSLLAAKPNPNPCGW